jgi:cytochrome b6-f complex iron-sulfur subunit
MLSKNEKISRVQFLKKAGLSSAAIFALAFCSSACENETAAPSTGSSNNTITIDLSNATYSKLTTIGNYVVVNNVVVAHTNEDKYVAVPLTCSHEGRKEVTYNKTEFYCTAHGARFSNAGLGLNKDGSKGLKLYTVSQTGSVLTITV